MFYKKRVKPIFDFIFSSFGFLLISPFLLLLSMLLYISNDGKVFFVQERPGIRGKIFRIIKFKTMNDTKDEYGNLLPDNDRITKVGKFIRMYSVDELLQLINVIKGEMSLIGPRPLLVEYLPKYNAEQRRRHEVKPGITGWAQVNGRNSLSWGEKFKMDVWYVDNVSFRIDLKILVMTVSKILKRDGINSSDVETMEKFEGGT